MEGSFGFSNMDLTLKTELRKQLGGRVLAEHERHLGYILQYRAKYININK